MRSAPLILLACLLMLPIAGAKDTLASLEEPHQGIDKVWDVTVTEAESGQQRALVFRNPVGKSFTLVIYDGSGAEVFNRTGQLGIQTLPALQPGDYRFFVRGEGAFQVTARAFERILKVNEVNETLNGTHAYVLTPSQPYLVTFAGDVRVEWWSLQLAPEELTPPANRSATPGGAYVLTVRGEPGAAYSIALVPQASASPEKGAPGVPFLALLASLALLATIKRRT